MEFRRTGHGTNGGYQRHRKLHEPPCTLCRLANNAYVCLWRWTHDGWQERDRANARRRLAALNELARRHPEEFASILVRYPVSDPSVSSP